MVAYIETGYNVGVKIRHIQKGGDFMSYNGYTEARKKANEKYLAKQAEIKLRIKPEEKKIIEEKAREAGKSVNQYIKEKVL